jgi:type IV pilus assembly protein PilY1
VVLLTSGYNNCPRSAATGCVKDSTGDGVGYVYVLNAADGTQLTGSPISTGVGGNTDPSGLTHIVAQVDSNNVSRRVYGGDLQGNLWRFNIETASTFSVHKLATLKDSDGAVQPITVKPVVTTLNGSPIVYVGTGRYLGASDVGGTPKNSFYGIKDDLSTTTWYNNPRTYSSFTGQLAVDGTCPSGADASICNAGQKVRLVTPVNSSGSANGDLTSQNGWYLDFPAGAGEISFTDPGLKQGTLNFSTSVPVAATSGVCGADGDPGDDGAAMAYMLNYLTGGSVGTTSGVIASGLGSGVATAAQIVQLPDGTVVAKYRLSNGQEVVIKLRFSPTGGGVKRISWRELVSE